MPCKVKSIWNAYGLSENIGKYNFLPIFAFVICTACCALRPIKVLQTRYNKKEHDNYITPATKTNNVVFVTDNVFNARSHAAFENANPQQENALVTDRDIKNEKRRFDYANDPNKIKKLEIRRNKRLMNKTNKDSGDIGNPIYNSPTLNTSLKTAHDMLNSPTTSTDNIFVKSTGDY